MQDAELPDHYEACGMDATRIAVCWLRANGECGTEHSAPITISSAVAIRPQFARTYMPAPQPPEGYATLLEVDYANPDANQIVTLYERAAADSSHTAD